MNCKPAYFPHTSQKKYKLSRSFCYGGMRCNNEETKYIDEKLLRTLSPEQIANKKCKLKTPSFKRKYTDAYMRNI